MLSCEQHCQSGNNLQQRHCLAEFSPKKSFLGVGGKKIPVILAWVTKTASFRLSSRTLCCYHLMSRSYINTTPPRNPVQWQQQQMYYAVIDKNVMGMSPGVPIKV